jgi:hypothetical protein
MKKIKCSDLFDSGLSYPSSKKDYDKIDTLGGMWIINGGFLYKEIEDSVEDLLKNLKKKDNEK